MPASEISTLNRTAPVSYVRVVFLYDHGHSRIISTPACERITETLEKVAREQPSALSGTGLQAAVVIEGYDSAQLFSAATFRWLCGVGPDPAGKDPNWMGGAAEGSTLDAS